MSVQPRSRLYVAVITGLLASSYGLTSISLASAAEQTVEKKTRVLAGQTFTFVKIIDAKGNVRTEVSDGSNKLINEKDVPRGTAPLVDPRVLEALTKLEPAKLTSQTLQVEIALNLPVDVSNEVLETGSGEVEKGRWVKGLLNDKEISESDMTAHADRRAQEEQAARTKRNTARAQSLQDWANRHGLAGQKSLEEALAQGRLGATLDLTAKQLRALIDSRDAVLAGIEPHEPGKDDINDAMDATSISTSALPNANTRGNGIGIYMTESGCADESRITNYDRLSGSETDHSRNVGAILRAVSPDSFIYCRGGAVLPQSSDLDGVGGNSPIHIITRSHSSNDTISYNTLDRDWDNFSYDNNIAVFNSGGNTGAGTGNVRSPGKGLNVISVANYDDANDTIVSSSPFVDPDTGNEKPEISSPGASVTAGGFTMTGTSQATPHAAAFAADMMSHSTYLQYRPQLVKAKLLAGATDPISGGYDKVGLGGIDFASAQWSGHWYWWSGGTNAFNTFDAQDGATDGYVVKTLFVSNSWDKVRVVLSWLTRGTYTYDHRADAHPIGLDLDLSVYDPNGGYVGGSASWDDPFEDVTFTPTVSGNYTFKIRRYATRDSSLSLRMGMYVNYYAQ
ncbi:MAG: S8 family serine peptidase [Candidatus Competibacteraceae bacterium]|nr:S8 family serine peptidase [Candidatus Competibacteraceae bacterium]MBK8895849.1 S8 family serine peptidase [Candidatus Competibacteraceae bacterium]MBK9953124.1 S8 family serine peptidase [Candidatus Competibacteraceae bacterium]